MLSPVYHILRTTATKMRIYQLYISLCLTLQLASGKASNLAPPLCTRNEKGEDWVGRDVVHKPEFHNCWLYYWYEMHQSYKWNFCAMRQHSGYPAVFICCLIVCMTLKDMTWINPCWSHHHDWLITDSRSDWIKITHTTAEIFSV